MNLQDIFSELYGGSDKQDDWIASRLLAPPLPTWVRADGTYDYIAAEIERASTLPSEAWEEWWILSDSYIASAFERAADHEEQLAHHITKQRVRSRH